MAKQGDLCCGSLWWENVSVLTMSVSISWLWYMFARCHHQGEMGRGYTGSLSLLFSYDYIRLHNYLNRKYLIKKKKDSNQKKNGDFTHCPNAIFLFEKDNLKAVPFGKGISHHQIHQDQPLLSARYKNTRISDFHTINT